MDDLPDQYYKIPLARTRSPRVASKYWFKVGASLIGGPCFVFLSTRVRIRSSGAAKSSELFNLVSLKHSNILKHPRGVYRQDHLSHQLRWARTLVRGKEYDDGLQHTRPYNTTKSALRERFCKRRLVPDWELLTWGRDQLHNRAWPEPLGQASVPVRMHISQQNELDMSRPAILVGALAEWPNYTDWTPYSLLQKHSDTEFCVWNGNGEISAYFQDPIHMTFGDYYAYSERQCDDSPLYLLEDFQVRCIDWPLASTWATPKCFQEEDFLSVLGSRFRPDYRLILIGAERSGTALHVDEDNTCAWNTLVSGRKRWLMFPPLTTEEEINPRPELSDSAAHWLHYSYPEISSSVTLFFDFVQNPGETVYVPNGWWHAVVNLELSVAATGRFVGKHNLRDSYTLIRGMDPEYASYWLEAMKAQPFSRSYAQELESQDTDTYLHRVPVPKDR